jgi:hypothetical protein
LLKNGYVSAPEDAKQMAAYLDAESIFSEKKSVHP